MIARVESWELASVVDLAEWFYNQQNRPGKFNRDVWIHTWTKLVDSGTALIMKRTFKDRTAEAIGTVIYADPNDGKMAAYSGFWYFNGEPKGLSGGLLYAELERQLKERGVMRLFITSLSNQRETKVARYLTHNGYQPMEVVYVKELHPCP